MSTTSERSATWTAPPGPPWVVNIRAGRPPTAILVWNARRSRAATSRVADSTGTRYGVEST
ncbi:hypothetical protein [Embleya scabrispora]|uniref:hypothetical protein n=1 Tax=Embleya scabrispora TaxID=159449 RepID=UPI00036A673F|nr:hypothetical protein [Embleya scabrispora]MYS80314.1 hypothetical protein [Streptomyces sp. SID5474]